ncbi:hypothetical protein C8Q73DRAFT_158560 [Cubamyces lactineus]|nr:hypothetical protein C8Q73DRAFT_158560 [Cubamyces lactineus]
MSNTRVLTASEVAAHGSRESCWIIVHGQSPFRTRLVHACRRRLLTLGRYAGKVYDVTDFLDGMCSAIAFAAWRWQWLMNGRAQNILAAAKSS